MLSEYQRNMVLSIYMGSMLHDAVSDLMRLHPDTPPDTFALFERFLAWTNPRRQQSGTT